MSPPLLITSNILIMQPKNYATKGKKQTEVKDWPEVSLYGYFVPYYTAMQKESDSSGISL
jgi:hypothetical protein